MNELIQELIAEAVNGRIVINDDYYNIGFDTIIRDGSNEILFTKNHNIDLLFPTLIIDDYEEFLYKITSYVEKAKEFYADELMTRYSSYSDKDVSKLLISLIWSNATATDFSNPLEFLDRRISFLDNQITADAAVIEDISIFNNADIHYSVDKSPLVLEAPYVLNMKVKNQESYLNEYYLPNIYFGLVDDKVYIYSIQNKNKKANDNKTKFNKMVKRNLNKVKKGFVSDISLDSMDLSSIQEFNINHPENLISVDSSSLVSLTVALAILKNEDVKEIVVPDFFPIRYNSSVIISELKSERQGNKQLFLEDENKKRERINRNIVDKKIRTFRRLSSHFMNLDINALPKDIDDSMHIKIGDNYFCDNKVLDEIYLKTSVISKKSDKKRI